jgi:hypothetical protein
MSRIDELHTGWLKDPAYRVEYDALDGELALAAALIRARAEAGLTQEQLAERMGTKQEVVARREGGEVMPLHAHTGAAGKNDRDDAADHLRAVAERFPRVTWLNTENSLGNGTSDAFQRPLLRSCSKFPRG